MEDGVHLEGKSETCFCHVRNQTDMDRAGSVENHTQRSERLAMALEAEYGAAADNAVAGNGSGVERYKTGATRSSETSYDPDGFLNPRVLEIFCQYMEGHRAQKDGKLRDSDNWQKGMPTKRAFRSLARHYNDAWLISRGYKPHSADCHGIVDALCGVMFNAMLLLKNYDSGEHE